ncbi:MAG: ATP-binding cassette domain-containing protein [Bdellovibrionota bacterium]
MNLTPNNLLQLQDATKSFGAQLLFEMASFSINENEHVGVIGPNGAGKTSLFQILAGELDLDSGEVIKSKGLRIGYLKQHDLWDENQSLDSFLASGTSLPLWDLKKIGLGLGLREKQFQMPIKSLSGGYRMRAKLLHLIGQEPDLMLLDEPTNYLDLETLLVLEKFLQNYERAFLLISHDREFLRRTTDHILEIENGEFTKFNGNIDDYFEQKQLLREQLEKQALSQAQKRKEILDFVARFGAKASKARQAQSRLKRLSKFEKIELKKLPVMAKIRIPEPSKTGRIAIEVNEAELGYSEKTVIHNLNLKIESSDKIGVVGLNGAGKSTLLKSLAREIPLIDGKMEYGYQVESAFYGQHVTERLNPNDSVLDSLQKTADSKVRPQEILDLAGSLLFSGDRVKKKIHVLSGGEKARVALGQILLRRAPLLILDEPTNHLDFYTVEALTQALEEYAGSLIIVSHDRGFIGRISTKILEVNSGRLHLYPGSYEDYVWSLEKRQESGEILEEASADVQKAHTKAKPIPRQTEASASKPSAFFRNQIKELESQRRGLEKDISEFERKIKAIETRRNQQTEELQSANPQKASQLSLEISLSQKKMEELEAQYLEKLAEKEEIKLKIQELK